MDWMQFIAALISSLAWPVAVISLVCLLKQPITDLLQKAKSIKYLGVQVDLGEELKAVQDELITKASESTTSATQALPPAALQLAASAPRAAIMHSWFEVESALEVLLKKLGLEFPRTSRDVRFKMQILRDRNVIDELTHTTFLRLASVRNDAAHLTEQQLDYDDAVMMSTSCAWLIKKLQKAAPSSENAASD